MNLLRRISYACILKVPMQYPIFIRVSYPFNTNRLNLYKYSSIITKAWTDGDPRLPADAIRVPCSHRGGPLIERGRRSSRVGWFWFELHFVSTLTYFHYNLSLEFNILTFHYFNKINTWWAPAYYSDVMVVVIRILLAVKNQISTIGTREKGGRALFSLRAMQQEMTPLLWTIAWGAYG